MYTAKPALRLEFGTHHYDFHDYYLEPTTPDEYLIRYCSEKIFIDSNRNWGSPKNYDINRRGVAQRDKRMISFHVLAVDYNE